jgi:hypothetical protein
MGWVERVAIEHFYAVDVTGGGRNSAMSRKMSANRFLVMATSAIWNATYRPWLTTFAPILISFSLRVVIDQSLIGSGVASVRKKLPRL